MPSNVTHRFVSPILWKLNQPLYSSAIQHVFAVAVVYTHRSVPPRGEESLQTLVITSSDSDGYFRFILIGLYLACLLYNNHR